MRLREKRSGGRQRSARKRSRSAGWPARAYMARSLEETDRSEETPARRAWPWRARPRAERWPSAEHRRRREAQVSA